MQQQPTFGFSRCCSVETLCDYDSQSSCYPDTSNKLTVKRRYSAKSGALESWCRRTPCDKWQALSRSEVGQSQGRSSGIPKQPSCSGTFQVDFKRILNEEM